MACNTLELLLSCTKPLIYQLDTVQSGPIITENGFLPNTHNRHPTIIS